MEPLLACDRRHVSAGGSTICELRLPEESSQKPIDFSLVSSSANVKVPLTLHAPAGKNRIRFEVLADDGALQDNVTIEAKSSIGSTQTSLAVLSSGVPLLKLPKTLNVRTGSQIDFVATAVDAQNQSLPVIAGDLPQGASFDSSTGGFTWTPGDLNIGSASITFTARDIAGMKTTKNVRVNVLSGNPVIRGMRNGAGDNAPAACSPGARMTLLGTFLADDQQFVETDRVRLRVNGEVVPALSASASEIDYLCPNLNVGTRLSIAVEISDRVSQDWQTSMEETSPGLLSANRSGTGQGLVMHKGGLAALPRFNRDGAPAVAGDVVSLYATGIACSERSSEPRPLIYFGSTFTPVTSLAPSGLPGVCEVRTIIPEGLSGGKADVFLQTVKSDATPIRSNTISLAID